MIEEIDIVRVMFTVTCGATADPCPPEENLGRFRKLSEMPSDSNNPSQVGQLAQDQDQLVASLQGKHQAPDNEPSLVDIGHYRVEFRNGAGELVKVGRDVFVGIAKVPRNIFARDDETKLLRIIDPGYLNDMFSDIFQDLNKVGDIDFTWLTWVIVPLVEAVEGRFNPIGMGGSGR